MPLLDNECQRERTQMDIYKAEAVEDLQSRYDLWAQEYENDIASYGYKLPVVVAGFLGRLVSPSREITQMP